MSGADPYTCSCFFLQEVDASIGCWIEPYSKDELDATLWY